MEQNFIKTELCPTCAHGKTCSLGVKNQNPVLQCEEFEFMEKNFGAIPENIIGIKSSQIDSESSFSGLCESCDNRDSCILKNRETGIWHCEEYC